MPKVFVAHPNILRCDQHPGCADRAGLSFGMLGGSVPNSLNLINAAFDGQPAELIMSPRNG
jgi:hypothetical protein